MSIVQGSTTTFMQNLLNGNENFTTGTYYIALYNANANLVTVTLLGAGVTWYFPPAGFVVNGALTVPAYTKVEFWPIGFGGWLPIMSSAPASPNPAPCCSSGKL